jgi:hypothetical protein
MVLGACTPDWRQVESPRPAEAGRTGLIMGQADGRGKVHQLGMTCARRGVGRAGVEPAVLCLRAPMSAVVLEMVEAIKWRPGGSMGRLELPLWPPFDVSSGPIQSSGGPRPGAEVG